MHVLNAKHISLVAVPALTEDRYLLGIIAAGITMYNICKDIQEVIPGYSWLFIRAAIHQNTTFLFLNLMCKQRSTSAKILHG